MSNHSGNHKRIHTNDDRCDKRIEQTMKLKIICALLLFILQGCFQYSPYEARLLEHEKNIHQKSLQRIKALPITDTICFAFVGDPQRFYDATYSAVASINQQPDVLFTICAGDITDFGLVMEYQAMLQIFSFLTMPFFSVVGNHDLLYNGDFVYQTMFGPFNFYFDYSGFRFVFVNTNSREFNFNGKVPDISFLESCLSDTTKYQSAVIIAHVPPGNNDFDERLNTLYIQTLLNSPKVVLHLNGHNHDFSQYEWKNSNRTINCYNSYSVDKRRYLKIKIWHNHRNPSASISVEHISF